MWCNREILDEAAVRCAMELVISYGGAREWSDALADSDTAGVLRSVQMELGWLMGRCVVRGGFGRWGCLALRFACGVALNFCRSDSCVRTSSAVGFLG